MGGELLELNQFNIQPWLRTWLAGSCPNASLQQFLTIFLLQRLSSHVISETWLHKGH